MAHNMEQWHVGGRSPPRICGARLVATSLAGAANARRVRLITGLV
jgi:hypothetical protein